MSWNHGDWLSFAQAAASTIAIVGAYGVVFVQDRVGERHNIKRLEAVRSAIVEIATKGRDLTNEIYDPMSRYAEVGTWFQYRAFRSRQLMEYHDLVASLPGQDVAELGLLDVSMKLRVNLRDMEKIVGESNFDLVDSWNSSRRMITYCRKNFDQIAEKLGIEAND